MFSVGSNLIRENDLVYVENETLLFGKEFFFENTPKARISLSGNGVLPTTNENGNNKVTKPSTTRTRNQDYMMEKTCNRRSNSSRAPLHPRQKHPQVFVPCRAPPCSLILHRINKSHWLTSNAIESPRVAFLPQHPAHQEDKRVEAEAQRFWDHLPCPQPASCCSPVTYHHTGMCVVVEQPADCSVCTHTRTVLQAGCRPRAKNGSACFSYSSTWFE
jgi:hypothetical protein